MDFKSFVRKALVFLHLDLTKNLKYDRLTLSIMKEVISDNSNCMDVGCHKGEILDVILSLSKNGQHFGFEPIPLLYKQLKQNYEHKAHIYPYALSDINGKTSFNWVKNASAYSGIKKRKYEVKNPSIEEIEIEVRTADNIIPEGIKIDFIKIDVEGGEFGVLKGAERILTKSHPYVIFECGIGASDYYGTDPAALYQYITKNVGLSLSTLSSFVHKRRALTQDEFELNYNSNKEYYFIAYPKENG